MGLVCSPYDQFLPISPLALSINFRGSERFNYFLFVLLAGPSDEAERFQAPTFGIGFAPFSPRVVAPLHLSTWIAQEKGQEKGVQCRRQLRSPHTFQILSLWAHIKREKPVLQSLAWIGCVSRGAVWVRVRHGGSAQFTFVRQKQQQESIPCNT